MSWQALYDNPAARVKGWVKTLLQNQEALQRASGGWRLGQVLGCGHWGCVVDLLDSPWVLKLTVDPTEAHIWSKLVSLIEDERYGDDGFPRIKKIFELKPGISYGSQGRTRRAYGIVREKVVPVFGGRDLTTTPFTIQTLGMPHGWQWQQTGNMAQQVPQNHKMQEFATALSALMRYQEAAHAFHSGMGRATGQWKLGGRSLTRQESIQRAEAAASRMYGSIGGPLGESLTMLASNEVLLRDVHFGNIGWRFLEEIEGQEGYTCLVIFDPGHTPTDKRALPAESWIQLAQLC